jgi:hypothetical protein
MRQKKGFLGLALLTLLAFTITATFGGAASADPVAHTAGLKKCLKKAKRIQDPVKRKKAKKRCRKKFGTGTGTGTPGTTGSPLVRATLSWSSGGTSTDYDLYVFDPSGTIASSRSVSNPIPNTTFSGNVMGGAGTERFTDLIFAVPGRNFQFGVCHQDGGSDGTSYSITYVTADGVSHSDSRSGGSDGFNAKYSGGTPDLNTFTCPAP